MYDLHNITALREVFFDCNPNQYFSSKLPCFILLFDNNTLSKIIESSSMKAETFAISFTAIPAASRTVICIQLLNE